MGRRRIVLGLAAGSAAALLATGLTLAFSGVASATATMTVTPSTGLTGGTVVAIAGSGFHATAFGGMLECNDTSGQPTQALLGQNVPVSCTNPLSHIVTTSKTGAIPAGTTFTIVQGTVGPPVPGTPTDSTGGNAAADAAKYPCPPTQAQIDAGNTCSISYGDTSGDQVTVPITFQGQTVTTTTTTTTTPPPVLQTQPLPQPGNQPVGYRLVGEDGGVFDFGASNFYGARPDLPANDPIVGEASTTNGGGYWLVSKSGAVFAYGDANFYGGANNLSLSAPIVGMAGTADMGGYWLVGADGAVYCYGDARLWGTANTLTLNAPIVGIVGTLNGGGYWLVGADGGVYAFGNAPYDGSEGGQSINAKVTAIEPTANDGGYWLVGADGGVYAFGNAPYEGSEGGQSINAPVVGIVGDPSSQGYWLVGADGGVYAFGNAPFRGSANDPTYVPQPLDAPIIAAST